MHQCFGMVKLKDLELQDVSRVTAAEICFIGLGIDSSARRPYIVEFVWSQQGFTETMADY